MEYDKYGDSYYEYGGDYDTDAYQELIKATMHYNSIGSSASSPCTHATTELRNGKGTSYKNKASVKDLTTKNGKTITLYAQWEKVKVGKVSIKSAKSSKAAQLTVKYKAVSGANGYEISYSTDKNFKKSVTKKTTTKTSYTAKKLKKGKTYYVRVRAYKKDSAGKKVYGKYSAVKKVTVKKK